MIINENDLERYLKSITKQVTTIFNDGSRPIIRNIGISGNFILQLLNNRNLKYYVSRNYFGINTPIKHEHLPKANYSITFSEDVAKQLLSISSLTHQHDVEIPYLLIGDVVGNEITIKKLKIPEGYKPKARITDGIWLAQAMEKLAKLIKTHNLEESKCLIKGHSHPDSGNYYDNFSLGDIDNSFGLIEYNKAIYGGLNIASMMLTGDNQIRVGFYDENSKKFYTINTIQVKTNDNQIYYWSDWVKGYQNRRSR